MKASNPVTLSSTQRDLHGDIVSLKALEDLACQINRPTKGRVLVDHRRDIPPIGYWDDAAVVPNGDQHLLKARQVFYDLPEPLNGCPGLLIAKLENPLEFARHAMPEKPTIVIDKNNYPSFEVAHALIESIQKEYGDMSVELDSRKRFLVEPQISLILSDYWHLLYPYITFLGAKIGDVVLEETIGESYKSIKDRATQRLRNLIRIIRRTRQDAKTHGKPQITIFEIPGTPYIELFTKTSDVDLIARALKTGKLIKVHKRINELRKVLKPKEVQFILDKDGNWKFNYLITEEGSIVGTKETMQKRAKLFSRVQLNGVGYSIGGRVKYADPELPRNNSGNHENNHP